MKTKPPLTPPSTVCCTAQQVHASTTSEREDELHLLKCLHHVGARRDYLGDVTAAGVGDTFGDAWMRQTMNPEDAGSWRRQADFLITALALRDHKWICLTMHS